MRNRRMYLALGDGQGAWDLRLGALGRKDLPLPARHEAAGAATPARAAPAHGVGVAFDVQPVRSLTLGLAVSDARGWPAGSRAPRFDPDGAFAALRVGLTRGDHDRCAHRAAVTVWREGRTDAAGTSVSGHACVGDRVQTFVDLDLPGAGAAAAAPAIAAGLAWTQGRRTGNVAMAWDDRDGVARASASAVMNVPVTRRFVLEPSVALRALDRRADPGGIRAEIAVRAKMKF